MTSLRKRMQDGQKIRALKKWRLFNRVVKPGVSSLRKRMQDGQKLRALNKWRLFKRVGVAGVAACEFVTRRCDDAESLASQADTLENMISNLHARRASLPNDCDDVFTWRERMHTMQWLTNTIIQKEQDLLTLYDLALKTNIDELALRQTTHTPAEVDLNELKQLRALKKWRLFSPPTRQRGRKQKRPVRITGSAATKEGLSWPQVVKMRSASAFIVQCQCLMSRITSPTNGDV